LCGAMSSSIALMAAVLLAYGVRDIFFLSNKKGARPQPQSYDLTYLPSITVLGLAGSYVKCRHTRPTSGTTRRSFWALLVYSMSSGGLRPPCRYSQTRNIILWEYPMSLSEANSFQLTWGEPTHGVSGLYIIIQISSISRLCLYHITFSRVCQELSELLTHWS
jgi:hypothetical protein